jgi:hypothetical protein
MVVSTQPFKLEHRENNLSELASNLNIHRENQTDICPSFNARATAS